MADITVVGGGIIGLLLAKELVQQGAKVLVLDRAQMGTEASWAGGGIVSPLYPWNYSQPVTALASWAQMAYPDLAGELKGATAIDPELNPCGLMMLDPPNGDRIRAWAADSGKTMAELTQQQVLAQEPAVGASFSSAVWWPELGNIRNPRLLKSLVAFLQHHPLCELQTGVTVLGFGVLPDGSVRVQTQHGAVDSDKVAVCAGAWAGELLTSIQAQVLVQPVRGQMLVFEPAPGLINSMILHLGRYLIPRLDGRILVGSTLEYTEFDKSTTAEARESLLQFAYQLVPQLRQVAVEAHWAGLRPGSPDGIPFIGKVPGWDNLYVNAGHFRNGLVLAPASARLMRDLLLGSQPIVDPAPYDPLTPRPTGELY